MTSALPLVCDLTPSNALLRVSGDDAAEFLHNQFTNDVKGLAVGGAQWNGWCTPKGRLLATFVLARDAEGFFLMLPAAFAEAIAKRLRMFVLRSKVKVEDVSAGAPRFGMWGGPIPAGAFRLGESRAIAIGSAPEGRAASHDDWALSLIRDGVVQVVPGTQEEFVPQMANYELIGGVSFKKGCYPGQEIVARTQYRGILKKRAVRVCSASPLAPGDRIFSEAFGDQSAGTVANVAPSPEGGYEALVVAQLEAIAQKSLRHGSLAGPALRIETLPYPLS
ncbi:MAG: folate-binding protein YgfZ [Betaproteobacteria bacterium]|nr:folate-binding protein YgfZ [Betaproteobacteria bacterium]